MMEMALSILAIAIAFLSICLSLYFWRKQFRPILTAGVVTANAGRQAIAYNLEIQNSGSLPAKKVRVTISESECKAKSIGTATDSDLKSWIRDINDSTIPVLQNGSAMSCSFGHTKANDSGFWKYGAKIDIRLDYNGFFGRRFVETCTVSILDSNSFTGNQWSTAQQGVAPDG